MTTTYHKEYPADQTAMQAMRAELRLQPALEFGPEARPVYDELIARTPAAQDVTYEAATVGGVPGWWCRPSDAVGGAAILYLHGGAYILGSAAAYRNFTGQIAARAKAAADNVRFLVRRAKARSFSGCESRPATFVPAGSNRSSREGNEAAEASGVEGHTSDLASVQAVT